MTVMTLEALSPFVFTPEKTTSSRNLLKSWGAVLQDALQLATAQETESTVFIKPQLTDEQLMSAISTGNESAIEMLYDRYHRYAYALAYRILRDPVTAEDIVQDAFLSIWRKASSYQAQNGSVQSWIQ